MVKKPKYRENFDIYIKTRTTSGERKKVELQTYKSNSRTCVIMHGSWIEDTLELALKVLMKPHSSPALFSSTGAIGTFGSKVELCYSFALFGEKTYHDVGLIKALRNGFADSMRPMYFKEKLIEDALQG